jgi:hypothetical protein
VVRKRSSPLPLPMASAAGADPTKRGNAGGMRSGLYRHQAVAIGSIRLGLLFSMFPTRTLMRDVTMHAGGVAPKYIP